MHTRGTFFLMLTLLSFLYAPTGQARSVCALAVAKYVPKRPAGSTYLIGPGSGKFQTLTREAYYVLRAVKRHLEWLNDHRSVPLFAAEADYWAVVFEGHQEYIALSGEVAELLSGRATSAHPREDRRRAFGELFPRLEAMSIPLARALEELETELRFETDLLRGLPEPTRWEIQQATHDLAFWVHGRPLPSNHWDEVRTSSGLLTTNLRLLEKWQAYVEASRAGFNALENLELEDEAHARRQHFANGGSPLWIPQDPKPSAAPVEPPASQPTTLSAETLARAAAFEKTLRVQLPPAALARLETSEQFTGGSTDPQLENLAYEWLALVERLGAQNRLPSKEVRREIEIFILKAIPRRVPLRNEKFELHISTHEGRDKAAKLIEDLTRTYIRMAQERGWQIKKLKETRSAHLDVNFVSLQISGLGAVDDFEREVGIHSVHMVATGSGAHGSQKTFSNSVKVQLTDSAIPERHVRLYDHKGNRVIDKLSKLKMPGGIDDFFGSTEMLSTLWREAAIAELR